MVIESRASGYKILLAAVAFSFAVHLFWLFAVRIVVSPAQATHTKVSRVTFLGPILSKVNTEVRAERARRTYLEDRYVDRFDAPEFVFARDAANRGTRYESPTDSNSAAETRYVASVGAAVGKVKIEPEYKAK